MKLWMDVMRDLESVMADHDRIFDAWAEGGVDGLVVGPMAFDAVKLQPGVKRVQCERPQAPAFDPDPAVYARLGVETPPAPEPQPDRRRLLDRTLRSARDHGFSLFIMYAESGAGAGVGGHYLGDERGLRARVARMVDTLEHYPMADGAIMDGPEWGYEIDVDHMNRRSYIFDELPPELGPVCSALGYEYRELVAARDRLYGTLHELDARRVRSHARGGLLGAFHLLGSDPGLLAWMEFRARSMTDFVRKVRTLLARELGRPARLGIGPRSAAFAPLTGMDMPRLGEFMDLLLPKHYFWHRGFDGFVGTVSRYVDTLCRWNPGLEDADAFAVVEALFGIELPGITNRADLERALTPEFFARVVSQETSRALAAVDDPQRIVPWVDAGRFPHDGDPLPARDLRLLLEAARGAGLERFLYHHQGNLTAGEWTVMSDLCGRRWDARTSGYRPADMLLL
jgi:hypothetical protein